RRAGAGRGGGQDRGGDPPDPLGDQQPEEHSIGVLPDLLLVLGVEPTCPRSLVLQLHAHREASPLRSANASVAAVALSGRRATGRRTQKQLPRVACSSIQTAPPCTVAARRQNT